MSEKVNVNLEYSGGWLNNELHVLVLVRHTDDCMNEVMVSSIEAPLFSVDPFPLYGMSRHLF